MKVLFDACTSPRLAAMLDGHLSATGGSAVHVRDVFGDTGAGDVAWFAHLRGAGPGRLVVAGDVRLHRLPALRCAYLQAGLRTLALAGAFQACAVERQASLLIERWPEVERLVAGTAAPFLFEVPGNRGGNLRSLPA